MPMIQIDIEPRENEWQPGIFLHEVDLEKLQDKINWLLSDSLRREYQGAGISAFEVVVRRYL